MAKTGRPTDYTPEIAAKICERIMEGESVRQICRDADMPGRSTVHLWLSQHEGFREQYRLAKEIMADDLFDEMEEIANDGRNDWMEEHSEQGSGWRLNHEHVQRSKLRIDAIKWRLSKMLPKKYGDRVAIAGDGDSPLTVNVVRYTDADNPDSE